MIMNKLSGLVVKGDGNFADKIRQSPIYKVRLHHESLPMGYMEKILVHDCNVDDIDKHSG